MIFFSYLVCNYWNLGKKGARWPGLSYPLQPISANKAEYGWLDTKEMGIRQVIPATLLKSTYVQSSWVGI